MKNWKVSQVESKDNEGSLESIKFYQNYKILGTSKIVVASSVASYTWRNVQPGKYNITAKATDPEGNTSTSEAIMVTVEGATVVNALESEYLQIFPNPVCDELKIKVSSQSNGTTLILTNSKGKQMMNKKLSENLLKSNV